MEIISKYQEIDTPALLIDLDILKKNINWMQDKALQHKVALRPHTKTHKMPVLARMQVDAGAMGITVAKISEAEVMSSEGFDDIFIANEIVGKAKLERLLKLNQKIKVAVGVDSPEQVAMYQEIFRRQSKRLALRIEVEVGENRTGVLTASDAVDLAKEIRKYDCLQLEGIFCHEGHCYNAKDLTQCRKLAIEAQQRMIRFADALRSEGENIQSVSIGATPSMLTTDILEGISEIRPGTYLLMDAAQGQLVDDFGRCAATILGTVISKPTKERIILDTGAKALTAQKRPTGICQTPGLGLIKNSENFRLDRVFDEHGIVVNEKMRKMVSIGDKLEIIPNHICPAVNLYDRAYLVSGDRIVTIVPVAARGKTQ